MNSDDWLVIGDRVVLLVCCVIILLYVTGVLR